MAVKTNITINIVEPGSDVPVPDTGLFTHGIGGTETTIIVSAALVTVLVILSIVLTTYMYRKHKKQGRTTKLVHIIDQTKAVVKSKKRITIGLSIIALLVSACTFTAFMLNTNNSNTSAIEGNDTEQQTENTNNLTINAESKELTIEVKDQPVFAVLPVQVTVEEATQAGYTLTAYTDNTDLVSTTNPNNKIPMVTVEGDELTSLQDNTWGLALDNEPTAKDNKVYKALSTDQTNPTLITDKDYEETEANDTTTIYYGFYITPDIPYGTYTGGEVEYEAEENKVATVTFDGNGLYYNNEPSQTTNIVKYIPGEIGETKYSHTPNLNDAGEVIDSSYPNRMYPTNTSETFVYNFDGNEKIYMELIETGTSRCNDEQKESDFFSLWSGNNQQYTAKDNYSSGLKIFNDADGRYVFGEYASKKWVNGVQVVNNEKTNLDGNILTIAYTTGDEDPYNEYCYSGYGYYITATGYNSNKNIKGAYRVPTTTSIENYKFLGWSTDPEATSAEYSSVDELENPITFDVKYGDHIVLYAVWSPIVDISYNGNGATAGSMESTDYDGNTTTLSHENVIAGDKIDLYAPNYKKDGYGFAGWSMHDDAWEELTDNDNTNDPVIYGPSQTVTISKDMTIDMVDTDMEGVFYAVWAPAEIKANGDPLTFQEWQGCSSLTATTYDSATDTLNVSNNTITALTDSRDGNVYTVARLADGNCWMIENLRLDDTAIISTANTNNPATVGGSVAIKNVNGSTSNHLSSSNNGRWCEEYNAACFEKSYLNSDNSRLGEDGLVATHYNDYNIQNSQWYSYGNYYNWYSATAGNGLYSVGRSGNIETVTGDICPAGWRLPIVNQAESEGSFSNLDINIGGTGERDQYTVEASRRWLSFPNNFVISGRQAYGSANDSRWYSYYWTASTNNESNAFIMRLSRSSGLNFRDYSEDKKYGYSVRCVTLAE